MQQLESSYNAQTAYNQHYQSASALQIRLETQQLMENIELFLKGEKVVVSQDENNKIITQKVSLGKRLANAQGVQSILNYISCIVNPQVVQGNFPSDGQGLSEMYYDYVEEVHVDFACNIVQNCYNWSIADEDLDVIIDFIMKLVIPFMTRLIDNEERKSYEATVKHIESSKISSAESGPKIFGQ